MNTENITPSPVAAGCPIASIAGPRQWAVTPTSLSEGRVGTTAVHSRPRAGCRAASRCALLLIGLVALTPWSPLRAATMDPSIASARKILSARQDSVLWISAVCKMSFSAEGGSDDPVNIPDQERKVECLGTVIGTNGMMVTALSSIDPSKEVSGREVRTASGTVRIEASSVLKEVRIVLPDGVEVPADVVMKDVDLDLAFLLARADAKEFKEAVFKAVDLKDSAPVSIADEVVSIARADEVLSRQPVVFNGQVNVLVKKPREFIRASSAGVGTPTFDLEGKLVGIGVVRSSKEKRSMVVLLPAADIEEIAEQARTAAAKPTK